MRRTVRRKIRWGRALLVFIVFSMLIASLAMAAKYIYNNVSQVTTLMTAKDNKAKRPDVVHNRMNILLLGLDDGDEEHPGSPRRSDTMIVVSINYDDGTVNLLSIPRDTRVNVPGYKGPDKINHAHFLGGADLAVKTVEEFLHQQISYYAVVDWQGFIKVIDLLGGVDLYVERNMDYEDPYANLKIHLKKGYQHLDGEKAGEYVRFRSDELGDIGRVQRQQRFLKALSSDMLQLSTVAKIPNVVGTLQQCIATDMTTWNMIKVAYGLKGIRTGGLHAEMLPGKFATIDGLSYWVADSDQMGQLVERMFNADSIQMSAVSPSGTSNN